MPGAPVPQVWVQGQMDYSVYKAKPTYFFFPRPPLHPSCYGTRQVGALPAAHASRALLLVQFSVISLPDVFSVLSHGPASSHFVPAPQQTSPTTSSLTLSRPHPTSSLTSLDQPYATTPPRRWPNLPVRISLSLPLLPLPLPLLSTS